MRWLDSRRSSHHYMKYKSVIPKKIKLTDELDRLANLYNKTKEKKYKEQWYELVKKIVRHIPN